MLKGEEQSEEEEEEEEEEGDADITFIPGLKANLTKALEEKEKEREEKSLSVYDQYRKRLREKRKEKCALEGGFEK